MYVKRNYGFWMTFNWSKKPFILGFLYATAICSINLLLPIRISLPWQPISIIGIAVAFYLGFKNNSSYDRTWEARKIWGGIVNNSRTFGAAIVSFVQGTDKEDIQKELVYRHLAWLTALRHQLRLSRPWEHTENRLNMLYAPVICEDYHQKLDRELGRFLPEEELLEIAGSTNVATQILRKQSERLQELKDLGYFEDFRHMEFHKLVTGFYTDQGKSERIKNFPFPRQYASTALWLSVVFCVFVPFGLLDVFVPKDFVPIGQPGFTFNILYAICPVISALIIWIFFLMEKIGDYSENPFEGTYNDVPITSISRSIEIDMREMIRDNNIPEPIIADEQGFVM